MLQHFNNFKGKRTWMIRDELAMGRRARLHDYMSYTNTPLSTGSLYPKFRGQTSGIIQKLYETKTNTNTG